MQNSSASVIGVLCMYSMFTLRANTAAATTPATLRPVSPKVIL